MARLIDADVIIDFIDMGHYRNPLETCFSERYVVDMLESAPTVDAVEVVRCRDCAKDGLLTCPICFIENKTLQFINHSPDFYCGEGERKDGDGNGLF